MKMIIIRCRKCRKLGRKFENFQWDMLSVKVKEDLKKNMLCSQCAKG